MEALARRYAGATTVVFPSLVEGLGFAALEVVARGMPVIAANPTALPESDAARHFIDLIASSGT